MRMYRPQTDCFVIQIRGEAQVHAAASNKFNSNNFAPMKLFHGFRKILMRFIFSTLPSSKSSPSSSSSSSSAVPGRYSTSRYGDRSEPPKTSCSSYHYSPNSHYTEAIADCIEFFNRSSQEGTFAGRKSDVLV